MSLNFNSANDVQYTKRIVMGVTKFRDEIDGELVDTCNVLVAAPLDVDSGNAMGFGTAKIRFGESVNYQRFAGLDFPCELELAFVRVTNAGGRSKDVLKDFRIPAKVVPAASNVKG